MIYIKTCFEVKLGYKNEVKKGASYAHVTLVNPDTLTRS